ncbi:MAG: hypothetical protein MI810_03195 [Flavobacteriales bacterium]|jgi:hypothetical protein|nr:hypothetical protein [Flavobacteriales bacterium]
MNYLKKEFNRLFPFSLVIGVIGGVLLILVNNLLSSKVLPILAVYALTIGCGVYLLNRMRYRKDTKSSVLYGYLLYAIMTVISFLDTLMNTNHFFHNPLFEQLWIFALIFFGVSIVSLLVTALFKGKILS